MNYFQKLVNNKSPESSKRFISLYCLGLFTIVIFCGIFQIKVEPEIIYGLISLVLGSSAMTLIQNNSKTITKDETKIM